VQPEKNGMVNKDILDISTPTGGDNMDFIPPYMGVG
jgi:hypothetical protein